MYLSLNCRPGSLLVVGPQAKMAGLLMGNYAESAAQGNWGTDILDAVTQRVGSNASVAWSQGCKDPNCATTDMIAAAADAAKTADVVIVTLGLWFNANGPADESEVIEQALCDPCCEPCCDTCCC
jgi:hypothetical protein